MLTIDRINALNIEISSACIAGCAFCSRRQKVREYGEHLITLDDFRKLPARLLSRLRRISFDGNFGDLSSNPEFPDITAAIREINPDIALCGHSHASHQAEDWWRRLGGTFTKGYMVFALDGLADTHRLHRRGTDFNTVTRNIRAFTAAGGEAWVQCIVFEHNEHQIREVESLARDLGGSVFCAISSRDYDSRLKPPATVGYNVKRDLFQASRDRLGGGAKALCKPVHKKSIYLAADGTVHPCCLAHCMYVTEFNDQFRFMSRLIEKHLADINFKTTPLEDIVSGGYFRDAIRAAEKSPYCIARCSPLRDQVLENLVIYESRLD